MLPLLTAFLLTAVPLQDTAHVVQVATTDVHGHVTDWDYLAGRPFDGGLVRVATVVDSLRARYPGEVVVVDAGDLLQGDAFASYFARVAPTTPHPIVVESPTKAMRATPGAACSSIAGPLKPCDSVRTPTFISVVSRLGPCL